MVLADWWREPSKGQVAAGRLGSHSLEQTSQSWTDTVGTSWRRTDKAGLRIPSQGLEEGPQKNKFLSCKKRPRLGVCKRQKATREKERANVALSAQD